MQDRYALIVDPNVARDAVAAPAAESEDLNRYSVDLQKEEGYGHTKRDHVAKSDEELLARIEAERRELRTPFGVIVRYNSAIGSFDSIESANDFVNRTIEANRDLVDDVIGGRRDYAKLEWIFGYRTGREAFLESGISKPVIRRTFGVRVIIHGDPNNVRGYRVRTAFPINVRRGPE